MYQDTITLFNRVTGDRGDTWIPTVIKNVNLNVDRAAILAKYGADSQDSAELHIRYTRDGDNVLVSGKPWELPKAWGKTEDTITFASGVNFDFFWEGEWTGGTVADADYVGDDGFYNHMNKNYDHVFAVTSVSRFSVIPYFRIMGK